jgi:hypothetical protein
VSLWARLLWLRRGGRELVVAGARSPGVPPPSLNFAAAEHLILFDKGAREWSASDWRFIRDVGRRRGRQRFNPGEGPCRTDSLKVRWASPEVCNSYCNPVTLLTTVPI